MEEKDAHHEPDEVLHRQDEDEDVEGHQNLGMNVEPDEVLHRQDDDDDDVEGHVNYAQNLGAPDNAVNIGREDEGDDVEGHVNIG